MNHEEARLLYMDYLFDEISDEERTKLENYLDQHPELKNELEGLSDTSDILNHMPVDEPTEKLIIVSSKAEEEAKPVKVWYMNRFVQTFSGVAAAIVILFMGAAITQPNISIGDEGFSMAFGTPEVVNEPVQSEPTFTADQVQSIIQQVQADNAQRMTELVSALQTDQQAQFSQSLNEFANFLNDQRNQDLQLISLGFDRLEESTYNKFRQTDEVIGELIQSVSAER